MLLRNLGIEKHQFRAEHDVKVGDYVRSYDFPGMLDDTYVEGTVEAVAPALRGMECSVYEIKAERHVVEGKDVTAEVRAKMNGQSLRIYPPVNGVPHAMGGYCHGVVKVSRP